MNICFLLQEKQTLPMAMSFKASVTSFRALNAFILFQKGVSLNWKWILKRYIHFLKINETYWFSSCPPNDLIYFLLTPQDKRFCFKHVLFCHHIYIYSYILLYDIYCLLCWSKEPTKFMKIPELHLTQVACCLKYDSWCVLYS